MSFTNQTENDALDTVYDPATTYYQALFTGDPTDAGSAALELTGNGYARTAVNFGAAANGQKSNVAKVTFPNPTADWPQATHTATCRAAVRGVADLIDVSPLDAPLTALANVPIEFDVGTLVKTLD